MEDFPFDPVIEFYSEDIEFDVQHKESLIAWIQQTIESERKEYQKLEFFFGSDEYLLELNREHLSHDYYTDVITFALSMDPIEADICISIDRVKDNSKTLGLKFDDELHRVIIHGVLHCLGFDDKDNKARQLMREKEDHYLSLRSWI